MQNGGNLHHPIVIALCFLSLFSFFFFFSTRRRQKVCNDFSWMPYLLPAICVRLFYVQLPPPPAFYLFSLHFHLNSGQEKGKTLGPFGAAANVDEAFF